MPVVVATIILAFNRLDQFMLAVVFLTPLSLNLQKTSLGIGVSLPAEPLIFGIMILFFLKLLQDGKLDNRMVKALQLNPTH